MTLVILTTTKVNVECTKMRKSFDQTNVIISWFGREYNRAPQQTEQAVE